jgi:outer membrane protein insertion porin family
VLTLKKIIVYFLFVILCSLATHPVSAKLSHLTEKSSKKKLHSSRIVQIQIVGNYLVPSDKILEMISSKMGTRFNKRKLKEDVRTIYDSGYFQKVSGNHYSLDNGIKLVFTVKENPVVKKVLITGTHLIPVSKIESLMKTVPGKILNTTTLYQDVLAINDYYVSQGYSEPTNHVVNLAWTKKGIVKLKIKEGIRIKAIDIKGDTVYPLAELKAKIHSKIGTVFNRKKMEQDLGRIARLYKEDGYVLSGLKGNIRPDGTYVVDITETIVQSMRIEGNKITKPYVIYRYIHTKTGSALNRKRVRNDLRRLHQTGYFTSVKVEPEPGTRPGKVVLVWRVREARQGIASIGIGYAGASGLYPGGITGDISISENNISGTGQGADITWQRGPYVSEIDVGYNNPFLDNQQDSISIQYFNSDYYNLQQYLPSVSNPTQLELSTFEDHQAGETFTWGRPLINQWTHIFVTLTHESVFANGINYTFSNTLIPFTQGIINEASTTLINDTRDNPMNPRKGSYYSATYGIGGGPFGGDFKFNQYEAEVRKYFTFHGKYTLAFRVMGGYDEGNIPITNWFTLGGPDTLRGYTLDTFLGTRMVLGQAELRFPIGHSKTFQGALFYDTGNAWAPSLGIQFGHLYDDYGVGINVNLPNLGLGIIRLDFALGGTQGTRTVIGIGQAF